LIDVHTQLKKNVGAKTAKQITTMPKGVLTTRKLMTKMHKAVLRGMFRLLQSIAQS
jgi:hypothetical protein